MPAIGKCIVKSCKNSKTTKKEQNQQLGLTYHRFPKNSVIRQEWVNALQLWAENITEKHRLCSEHFSKQDFDKSVPSLVRLRRNAVPISNSPIACKTESEIDIDSDSSDSDEQNCSSKMLNNFETIEMPVEDESFVERSLSPIFDNLDETPLEVSNIRTEITVNENKFDSNGKKFVDCLTSISTERSLNSSMSNPISQNNCNRSIEDEGKEVTLLRKNLHDAYLKIASLEAELVKVRGLVKELEDSG